MMVQRYEKIMFNYCNSVIIFNNFIVDLFAKEYILFKNEHFHNIFALKLHILKRKKTIFAPCY